MACKLFLLESVLLLNRGNMTVKLNPVLTIHRYKMNKVKLALLGLGTSAMVTFANATPSALETFGTSAEGEAAAVATAVASAMGAALAIFAIIYGGRIVLKGIRAVGK
jgi:hypothetical protein